VTRKHEKGRATNTPGSTDPPTQTKGPVEVIIQNRGESGTNRQVSPDPHRPHIPKALVQGVR
jgi:hypothetical protein